MSVDGQRKTLVSSYLGGTVSFQKVGIAFQRELVSALGDLGVENESVVGVASEYPNAPTPEARLRPTNSLTLSLVVGFGLYLAAKLGEKVIEGLGADLYEKVVRPQIETFWTRLSRARGRHDLILTLDHWFEGTGVLVRVEFRASSRWDGEPDIATVQRALRKAVFSIAEHGVTHRVMVYRVNDGALSNEPELLAALPQPGEPFPRPKPLNP